MQETPKSFFQRIKEGLRKTRESILGRIERFLPSDGSLDEKLEHLEEALIESDLGVDLALETIGLLKPELRSQKNISTDEIIGKLQLLLEKNFLSTDRSLIRSDGLAVTVFAGINGSGKTTSIAKIASLLAREGKKVMIAACDTFRAAAIEQISLWGEKLGVPVVTCSYGADAASVAFDAIGSALARKADYLLIDTAGRLHSRKELMEELKKIIRIIEKKFPGLSLEKLFVLDGTTGQNGFIQAKAFHEAIGIDGIIITKLDGTAKGGIVLSIEKGLRIPVKFIGIGESMDDLMPFDPGSFVKAVLNR